MSEYDAIVEYILNDGRVLGLVFVMLATLVGSIVMVIRSYTKTQLTNNETTAQFMTFITEQTKALSAHLAAVQAVQQEIASLTKAVPTAGADIKQTIADWQTTGSLELHRVSDNIVSKIAPILESLDVLKAGVERIHRANVVQEEALKEISRAVVNSRDALIDALRATIVPPSAPSPSAPSPSPPAEQPLPSGQPSAPPSEQSSPLKEQPSVASAPSAVVPPPKQPPPPSEQSPSASALSASSPSASSDNDLTQSNKTAAN